LKSWAQRVFKWGREKHHGVVRALKPFLGWRGKASKGYPLSRTRNHDTATNIPFIGSLPSSGSMNDAKITRVEVMSAGTAYCLTLNLMKCVAGPYVM